MIINPDPSVPIKNPLWTPSCPIGATCQPFINPAHWIRPPYGTIGNGPRTYGNIRGPRQEFFDLSLQKNFYVFGKDSKKRIQARIDALNVFNHPNFGFSSIGGGTGFTAGRGPTNPSNSPIATTEYDSWVAADVGRASLARTTTAGAAAFNNVRNFVCNNITNTTACTGLLPPAYFSIAVPTGFTQIPLNNFDITTLDGFKQYRLSQVWSKNFGTLSTNLTFPRRVQYSIKFIF